MVASVDATLRRAYERRSVGAKSVYRNESPAEGNRRFFTFGGLRFVIAALPATIDSNLRTRRFFCVMNPYVLAALGRERRRAVQAEFARGDVLGIALRVALARALRRAGERLFLIGVALEGRVSSVPVVETRSS
jgi:hypothetical protein